MADFINWCNVNGASLANDMKALIMGMTQQAPLSLIVNAQQQFADAQKNWLEKVRDIYLLIEGQFQKRNSFRSNSVKGIF